MKYKSLQNIKNAFWQSAAIVVIAGFTALAVNHFREDGIALVSDWSPAGRLEVASDNGDVTISADQAVAFHESGDAIFIDIRVPETFSEGRITGAMNIPKHDVFDHLVTLMEAVPEKDKVIIVYCEKEPCPLSREMVRLLKDTGYENARLMENGWARWKDRGYPGTEG